MAITNEELIKLLSVHADIEKISTLSSDGKNLLTRIPKEVREYFDLQKGGKIRWIIDSKGDIKIKFIKNAKKKKERSRRN